MNTLSRYFVYCINELLLIVFEICCMEDLFPRGKKREFYFTHYAEYLQL